MLKSIEFVLWYNNCIIEVAANLSTSYERVQWKYAIVDSNNISHEIHHEIFSERSLCHKEDIEKLAKTYIDNNLCCNYEPKTLHLFRLIHVLIEKISYIIKQNWLRTLR